MNLGTGVNPSQNPGAEQAPQTEANKLRERFQLWFESDQLPHNAEAGVKALEGRFISKATGRIDAAKQADSDKMVPFEPDNKGWISNEKRIYKIAEAGLKNNAVWVRLEETAQDPCVYEASLAGDEQVHDYLFAWEFTDQVEQVAA